MDLPFFTSRSTNSHRLLSLSTHRSVQINLKGCKTFCMAEWCAVIPSAFLMLRFTLTTLVLSFIYLGCISPHSSYHQLILWFSILSSRLFNSCDGSGSSWSVTHSLYRQHNPFDKHSFWDPFDPFVCPFVRFLPGPKSRCCANSLWVLRGNLKSVLREKKMWQDVMLTCIKYLFQLIFSRMKCCSLIAHVVHDMRASVRQLVIITFLRSQYITHFTQLLVFHFIFIDDDGVCCQSVRRVCLDATNNVAESSTLGIVFPKGRRSRVSAIMKRIWDV